MENYFYGFFETYLFTTEPLGSTEPNLFMALSTMNKTFIVLRNLGLWACFWVIWFIVAYIYIMVIEQLYIVVGVAAGVGYCILRPFLGSNVFAFDNATVVTAWWTTWASIWIIFFYFAHGVTLFEIACLALCLGAFLRVCSTFGPDLFTSSRCYYLRLRRGSRSHNSDNAVESAPTQNVFIEEAFQWQKEFAWHLWTLRILNMDHLMRLKFGTWTMVPASSATYDFAGLAISLIGYSLLAYLFKKKKLIRDLPYNIIYYSTVCMRTSLCTHEDCAICLDKLCNSAKTLQRFRLSVKQFAPKLNISAAKLAKTPIAKLKCNHIFHEACISSWINRSRASCPVCRAVFGEAKHSDVGDEVFSIGLSLCVLFLGCFLGFSAVRYAHQLW